MPYTSAFRAPAEMLPGWEGRPTRQLLRVAEVPVVPGPQEDTEGDGADRDEADLPRGRPGRSIDLHIFRPDAFEAVWQTIVGTRAARDRAALTPEAWRRLWLNGYAHLRKEDPGFYASNAYGLEQAIAVLAPVIRKIEAEFRDADVRRSRLQLRSWSRCPPSAATLSRWLRTEAEVSARMAGARSLS